jgi:hypothetical protein
MTATGSEKKPARLPATGQSEIARRYSEVARRHAAVSPGSDQRLRALYNLQDFAGELHRRAQAAISEIETARPPKHVRPR